MIVLCIDHHIIRRMLLDFLTGNFLTINLRCKKLVYTYFTSRYVAVSWMIDGVQVMNRIVLILCVIVLLVPVGFAQDSAGLSGLCDVELVDGGMAICEAFVSCIGDEYYVPTECTQSLYEDMLTICAGEACENDALLSITAISASSDHYFERGEHEAFQRSMNEALALYKQGFNPQAGKALLLMHDDYEHRYLPYASALAYGYEDASESDLYPYEVAIETQFFTPLAYYSRGHLYLAMGDNDRASRDFYTFNATEDVFFDFREWLAVPEMTYEFPEEHDVWNMYHLLGRDASPGGTIYRDMMSSGGRDVEMVWLDDGATLVINGTFVGMELFGYPVPEILFLSCDDDVCIADLSLQETYPGLTPSGALLRMDFSEAIAEVSLLTVASESLSEVYSVMLPDGEPDPRPVKTCENGVYSRLSEGDMARTNPEWQGITLYSGTNTELGAIAELSNAELVINGPMECNEVGNWWPVVTMDGVDGWVLEAVDGRYQVVNDDAFTFEAIFALDN